MHERVTLTLRMLIAHQFYIWKKRTNARHTFEHTLDEWRGISRLFIWASRQNSRFHGSLVYASSVQEWCVDCFYSTFTGSNCGYSTTGFHHTRCQVHVHERVAYIVYGIFGSSWRGWVTHMKIPNLYHSCIIIICARDRGKKCEHRFPFDFPQNEWPIPES